MDFPDIFMYQGPSKKFSSHREMDEATGEPRPACNVADERHQPLGEPTFLPGGESSCDPDCLGEICVKCSTMMRKMLIISGR